MNHFSWKMTIKENEIFREIIDCEVELNSSEMQPVKAIFIEGILEPEKESFQDFQQKQHFFFARSMLPSCSSREKMQKLKITDCKRCLK